ncbi:MAG: hypothetical protein LBP96_04770 [Bacteroidales bacterium]|jgi:hypothetical protein|nr:hypothetical protein [Bacteroidales bacterium]
MKRNLLIIFLAIGSVLNGQDLDRILNSQLFSHGGSVAFNTVSHFGQSSQNPFVYTLSANYNPEIFGISVPFSMMYGNQKMAYGLPFRNWQLAPSYRWVRTQFGEANVRLSPYSLSGHRFRGVAVDVQPNQNWTFSALYGRLNDYRAADSTGNGSLERLCYGLKVGYNSPMYGFTGSFFKAKDETKSNLDIVPQENVVFSFSGHRTLAKNIRLSGDFASSALTQNTNDERVYSNLQVRSLAGSFLPYRLSTAVFHAYKINIGSPFLNVGYEYVAPNYQSLGTHFFTNDFQNFTINGLRKFRNVTVGGRFGVQNDDLNNQKSNSSRRLVYAGNLDYNSTSRISGQLNYSTFQTITRIEKMLTEFDNTNPYAGLDTLNFRQVEQHGDVSISYRLRETAHSQQQIQMFVSLQNASQNGWFATSSLNYSWSEKSGKNSGVSAFLHSDNSVENSRSSLGLTAFFGNVFSEKRGRWRVTASQTQDFNQQNALIVKASASYVFRKKHPVQMQFSQRFGKDYAAMITL